MKVSVNDRIDHRSDTLIQFGKTIQSQQVPGWGEYYLNYKVSPIIQPFPPCIQKSDRNEPRLSRKSSIHTQQVDLRPTHHCCPSVYVLQNVHYHLPLDLRLLLPSMLSLPHRRSPLPQTSREYIRRTWTHCHQRWNRPHRVGQA